ncbi:hypothetical protein BB561_006826, partial [Smittium simulii]
MIIYKKLLPAWIFTQALLQITISADGPSTEVLYHNKPTVTHIKNGANIVCDKNGCKATTNINNKKRNEYNEKYKERCRNGEQKCISGKNGYEECVNGKLRFKECYYNQKCIDINGSKALCTTRNIVPKCRNGDQKCNKNQTGIDECVNGKLVFKECRYNQRCEIINGYKARCADRNIIPKCKNGNQACNKYQEGIDECVYGKLIFKVCKPGHKCVANGNKAICKNIKSYPVCEEGSFKCNDEKTGFNKCVNNKLEFIPCKTNQKCITNGKYAYCERVKPDPICEEGSAKCNAEKNGFEHCVNNKIQFKPCKANQKCVAKDKYAYCETVKPDPVCEEGTAKCNDEKTGFNKCVNNKLEFMPCKANQKCITNGKQCKDTEKCVDLGFFVATCQPKDPGPVCEQGTGKCVANRNGFEECVNNEYVFKQCKDTEQCVNKGLFASCQPNDPGPVCEQGTGKCVPNQNGYQECVNNDYVFRQCKDTEKCVDLGFFVATCQPKDPASCVKEEIEEKCLEGTIICNKELTGVNVCIEGKLTFNKCKADEKCFNNKCENAFERCV